MREFCNDPQFLEMCIYISENSFRTSRAINQITCRELCFKKWTSENSFSCQFGTCAMGCNRVLTIPSEQNGNEQCLNSVKTKLAVIFWRNCRKPLYYKLGDYLRTSRPHDVRLQMPALASPTAWTHFNSTWLSVACCIRQNLTKANYLATRGTNKRAPTTILHTRCNS